jgi:hypothetical protein
MESSTQGLHPDWQNRLDQIIPLIQEQIKHQHSNRDFIIERTYKFIGISNIVFFALINSLHPPKVVLIAMFGYFLVVLISILNVIKTSDVQLMGLTPEVIELSKIKNKSSEEIYLYNDSWVVSDKVDTPQYYAWRIDALNKQFDFMKQENKKLRDI